MLHQAQQRLDLAAQLFTLALEQDPGYLSAVLSLGDVYSLKGDPASAVASYNTFINNWDGDPRALNLLTERLASLASVLKQVLRRIVHPFTFGQASGPFDFQVAGAPETREWLGIQERMRVFPSRSATPSPKFG